VQFLLEAGLLRKEELVVSHYGTDLSGANLSEVPNLYKADLSNAILRGADLAEAMLLRADLSKANLSGACLIGAKLHRSDLREADLSRAKGWTEEQPEPFAYAFMATASHETTAHATRRRTS
jgi:uncharacterized protein YjbI with pentapeptide repeats